MNLTAVVLVVLLALVLGGVGLAVDALKWLLAVALVLIVVSVALGGLSVRRGDRGPRL